MSNVPAGLPLFYRKPEPLSAEAHADWRLLDGDEAFAGGTAFVPILTSEIVAAARDYPIVFTADTTTPIAVLGLEQANLFVQDGQWDDTVYVPAYVRRYPFAFMATREPDGFRLAIDAASPRAVQGGEAGTALFDDGKPSALTQQALEFCAAFERDAAVTDAFIAALGEQDILIDRRADATMPDGRAFGVQGFRIVDREKFAALPDSVVLAWHKAGYLTLIHLHLASLDRFATLLARQGKR
ncbi:SapC family protein [Sphingomonas sp. PB4P5]|uniref:SapC family protein n=1 Tax=Parasphingomonas puruogangriensis TaxID=3096155 RepID=UPI002FC77BD7